MDNPLHHHDARAAEVTAALLPVSLHCAVAASLRRDARPARTVQSAARGAVRLSTSSTLGNTRNVTNETFIISL